MAHSATRREGQRTDCATVVREGNTLGITAKRLVRALLATGGAITVLMATSPVASAATARNGVCETGEFCLYHGFDFSGSVSDFNTSIANYGSTQPSCYEFKGPGTGQGQCVKNNALSGLNLTSHVVRVYYNSNYGGIYVTFQPGDSLDGDLGQLDWENASHKFF
jgi:Peptidase inhibitor family I36